MKNYDSLARYMDETVRGAHHVPGCDLMVYRDHELLYRYITGTADYDGRVPLTENNLYYMYSCTKPVTVTAGMRLVEEGKLSLDAPAADYLPALGNVFLEENGVRRAPKKPVTVRHLFTMSAGFDYAGGGEAQAELIRRTNGTADTRQIVETYVTRPLCFEPGWRFQYSMCHDVLAAVIEIASGMRFSDYLASILFTPVGMKDSTFHPTEADSARLAAQYTNAGNGNVAPASMKNGFRVTENYESGGAGLITSTADYAKFADAMACEGRAANGYRLLWPETVELLRTEQLSRFAGDTSFGCAAGPGYGYGLGVRTRVNQNEGQRSPIGEFGWDGAAGAYVMMDAKNHLSITFTMHVLGWPGVIGSDHAVLRDMVYDILGL